MNYENILRKWGINVSLDGYLPELLMGAFPKNCFYIDSLPISVSKKNANKFEQTEKIMFKDMHQKMHSIITKLWLFNDVYLNSKLLLEKETIQNNKNVKEELLNKVASLIPNNDNSGVWEIKKQNQISLILEMGYRDIIDVELFFEQYQLLIVASWSCYFIFMSDLSKLDIVEKIINVEGLYLRR